MTSLPHRMVHFIRNRTRIGSVLAGLWHKCMPPIPVYKRFYGVKVCLSLRDSLFYLGSSAKHVEETERFHDMLAGVKGSAWDVGCNVGIFSLLAASKKLKTVAFDISPVAIGLVQRSARANGLEVQTVCQAFAAEKFLYTPPRDADTRNALSPAGASNSVSSMTFGEAEEKFGTPGFIKVDIEHHEVALLKSEAFHQWIKTKNIPLLIELHDPAYRDLLWKDVEILQFDDVHVLINPLPEHKTVCRPS